jgi:hypothetical protein
MPAFRPIGPSLALAAYAESLIVGRRVIVFGDACSPLAEALLERGARLVHVCDPDPARVAEGAARNTSSSVTYESLGEGGLGVREGAFDVAIVENLGALAEVDGVLRRVKRALSSRGVALVASPNPDAKTRLLRDTSSGPIPDYYRLYDQVASEFAEVRMVGQAPLVGYTVADFAPDGEPSPTFDTGYVQNGAEEPEWFVAVASQAPVTHAEFVVVELPAEDVLEMASSSGLEQQLEQAQETELRARERIAELEAELDQQPEPQPREDERVLGLTAELDKRDRWIRALEARADTADARADTAESELETLRERARQAETEQHALTGQVRDLEHQLVEQRARAGKLGDELAAKDARLTELGELAAKDARLTELGELEAQSAEDLGRLEQQLTERAQQVQQLERQLADAQRLGRELVAELETREPSLSAIEALKAQLDRLAALHAEREADLEAARWSIQSLEFELGLGRGAEAPLPEESAPAVPECR